MPAKGKGKRKVTAGPMDPRKTREPVTGHPNNLYAALGSIMMSPPPSNTGFLGDLDRWKDLDAPRYHEDDEEQEQDLIEEFFGYLFAHFS